MIKIMFVCHGNICRSPMAEFVFKDLLHKSGIENLFYVCSSATSTEEIGNPVHYGTKKKLKEFGISTKGKYSVQLKSSDYNDYNFILGMDSYNIKNILKIIGHDKDKKISRLLDFSENPRDIADPWYTGDFDTTYNDILEGCNALLKYILSQKCLLTS